MKKNLLVLYKKLICARGLAVILGIFMLASSAISFAYWRENLQGNATSSDYTINIGSGAPVYSMVTLEGGAQWAQSLVPIENEQSLGADEVTSIIFNFNVRWSPANLWIDFNEDNLLAHPGILTTAVEHIYLAPSGATEVPPDAEDIKNEKVAQSQTKYLFDIEITPVSQQITASTGLNEKDNPVQVSVRVRLNKPASLEQYQKIEGKRIFIELSFRVENQYDLGNWG